MTTHSETSPLTATGERLMTDNRTQTVPEHLHRYAIACELARGLDVLDVACGEGYGTMLLSKHAASAVGVDIARAAVDHATKKYTSGNLRFLHGSATAIPLATASVDVVVSFETIEHLREHDEMITEIRRVLRPGGTLIISSPDKRYYTDTTGYNNPFHLRELDCEEFRSLLGRYFKHIRLLLQRIVYGSVIVPESPSPGFTEYRGDFDGIESHAGLQEAVYNIAIASDEPLPDMTTSLWNATALHEQQIHDYQTQLAAVRKSGTKAFRRLRDAFRGVFR
jgi:ubiquinone/menaquinone biosynthesis C-methylase UbiE